jgi:hypothetical protein
MLANIYCHHYVQFEDLMYNELLLIFLYYGYSIRIVSSKNVVI